MARRKNAGPSVWSFVDVQLNDREWQQFAAAIDADASIAERTLLPRGRTLRQGLQLTIGCALSSEAGSTTRELRADLRQFVHNFKIAYRAMRPEMQESFRSEWPEFATEFADVVKHIANDLSEIERQKRARKIPDESEMFLANIMWLVGHCPKIRKSLPSKGSYESADNFPLYQISRTAVTIACNAAERHVPAAASKIKRLRNCAKSTFVSKLHRARRRPALIGGVLQST